MSTEVVSTKVPRFQRSYDTQIVVDRLRKLAPDDQVSYADLSELIGRDIQTVARGVLTSAIRIMRKEHDAVFDCVHGQGVKRLTDEEIVHQPEAAMKHIKRTATVAAEKLSKASFDKLPAAEKVRFNALASALGAIGHISTPAAVKRIESAVNQSHERLPIGKTLEVFQKN